MDDFNEMAGLDSAGATVPHISPFYNLPTHKNGTELTADFKEKWVVPYYMEIISYGNSKWIETIKEVKPKITKDVCLLLLGDFNWRTRLVGSYFAAVKGYSEFIDIIGTHLLKSEVCCVGHIYALTLVFFKDDNCIQYLNRYLDYYLTMPSLYFDQKFVMNAGLFYDNENKTSYFARHIDKWNAFQAERIKFELNQAREVAKILEQKEGIKSAENYLHLLQESQNKEQMLSTEFFDEQIAILRELNQYHI